MKLSFAKSHQGGSVCAGHNDSDLPLQHSSARASLKLILLVLGAWVSKPFDWWGPQLVLKFDKQPRARAGRTECFGDPTNKEKKYVMGGVENIHGDSFNVN